jgi:hypothetical protein
VKTLAKEHNSLVANKAADGTWSINHASMQGGWRLLSPAGAFVSETYFDLSGMSQREKTLFFEGATVQCPTLPVIASGAPGDNIAICDIMSSSPISDLDLTLFNVFGNSQVQGSINFESTIYARVEQFAVDANNATFGSMILANSAQLGSLGPTASDRIYSYRVLMVFGTLVGNRLDSTFARHLLQANAKSEEEYEYLMRMMRSYELQQSYDED